MKVPAVNTVKHILDLFNTVGVTIVASAGNDKKINQRVYPCAHKKSICVAGTDKYDFLYSQTNLGNEYINLFAPAESVVVVNHYFKDSTKISSGTSYAAAYVSGVVAQLLEANFIHNDILDAVIYYGAHGYLKDDLKGTPDILVRIPSNIPPTLYPTMLFYPSSNPTSEPTIEPTPDPTTSNFDVDLPKSNSTNSPTTVSIHARECTTFRLRKKCKARKRRCRWRFKKCGKRVKRV